MSDNINLVRVDDADADLGHRIPRGSILYQEDSGAYFITLRATVAGDTIRQMLLSNSLVNFDKFVGVYESEIELRLSAPLGSPGAYAYIYDPANQNIPMSIAGWNADVSSWQILGGSGAGSAGAPAFRPQSSYRKGDLVSDGTLLYMATTDFASQQNLAADVGVGNFVAIGGAGGIREWQTGTQYTAGDMVYDPAGTGLFVVTGDYTSLATIADDRAAGFIAPAVPLLPPFAPTTHPDRNTMLALSSGLKIGEYAFVENPADPTENGVYFVQNVPIRQLDDFGFIAYSQSLPDRGPLAAVPALLGIERTGPQRPQLDDLKWYDGRQLVLLVDDEAARLSLRYPDDIDVGTLCVQQDNGWTFRFNGPPAVGGISNADWRIFSDFLTVPDIAARNDLLKHKIHAGTWVGVYNTGQVFNWTGDPTNVLTDQGWYEVATIPPAFDILQTQVFDPEQSPGNQLHWLDHRTSMEVVAAQQDLLDRTIFPDSHLAPGKLVFCRANGIIYEHVADDTTRTNTMNDWKELSGAAKFIGGMRNLPDPKTTQISSGQLYIVRMDMAGEDYYRLITWDENVPAPPLPPDIPVVASIVAGAQNTLPSTITITSGQVTNNERSFHWEVDIDGNHHENDVLIPAGSDQDAIATAVETDLNAQGFATVQIARAANVITITPIGAGTAENIAARLLPTPPPPSGAWIYLNRKVWSKDTRADLDQQTDTVDGDLQFTLERDHLQMKVYEDGVWHTIHDDDDINARIASLSLFEGTTMELGGTAAGALELDELPNLWEMESLDDWSKVSHYWVYVGSAGYRVVSAAQEKAAAVTAGTDWGNIQVTANPSGAQAPGTPVRLTFQILDDTGQPTQINVDKTFTLRIETEKNGVKQYHEERFLISGATIPLPDAAALAAAIENLWVDGTIGLTFDHTAGDPFVTITPAADTAFQVFTSVDGGTPGIGEDLAGASLNPGDWIQISRNTSAPAGHQLHYSHIGGNLLTKDRADGLYSLADFAKGTYEQGALVVHDGDVYRATRAVTGTDPNPAPKPIEITTTPISAVVGNTLDGSPAATLETAATGNPRKGDVETATSPGVMPAGTFPFAGDAYATGDSFVYSDDTRLAGTGTTVEGWKYDSGWIAIGQTQPIPDPLIVSLPAPATPWDKVDISGGLKIVQTDQDLPHSAPAGEVYIVLQSAQGGNQQALFGYDPGSQQWQELGGGANQPIDLTGGTELMGIGLPVGSVIAFAGQNTPKGWITCDGSGYDTNLYHELFVVLGSPNVPDLTDMFIRGGMLPDPYTQHDDTTRLPRTNFSGRTQSAGNHHHNMHWEAGNTDGSWAWANDTFALNDGKGTQHRSFNKNTQDAGNHTHPFDVTNGGDAETAPKHVILRYIIKAADQSIMERQ